MVTVWLIGKLSMLSACTVRIASSVPIDLSRGMSAKREATGLPSTVTISVPGAQPAFSAGVPLPTLFTTILAVGPSDWVGRIGCGHDVRAHVAGKLRADFLEPLAEGPRRCRICADRGAHMPIARESASSFSAT